jgi:hypothetical protein
MDRGRNGENGQGIVTDAGGSALLTFTVALSSTLPGGRILGRKLLEAPGDTPYAHLGHALTTPETSSRAQVDGHACTATVLQPG